jgi:hypothetical protein
MKATKRPNRRKKDDTVQRLANMEKTLTAVADHIGQIRANVEEIKEHVNRERNRKSGFLSRRRRRTVEREEIPQPPERSAHPTDTAGLLDLAKQLDPNSIQALLQNPMIQSLLKNMR